MCGCVCGLGVYTCLDLCDEMCRYCQDHNNKVAKKKADTRVFRDSVHSGDAGVPTEEDAVIHVGRRIPKKLDLKTANRFKPPKTILYHESWTNRLRGFYGEQRLSHGCSLSKGTDTACRVVLEWMWFEHKLANPDITVPYDFHVNLEAGE